MLLRHRLILITRKFNLYFKRNTVTHFDPCTGCEIPCTKHVSYPPEILKQIDQSSMIDSVEKHSRHLCIGQSLSSSQWPKDIKDLQGNYIKELSRILNEKKDSIGYSIKLTSASIPSKNHQESTADWYLFPDQLKINNVDIKQIEKVVEKLVIKNQSIAENQNLPIFHEEIKCERLHGLWILVCCHYQRDQRCGIAGPILIEEIEKYIQQTNRTDAVHSLKISHIGGHRFAGNIIIYPSGTWYGRVLPCHIPLLIDAYTSSSKDLKDKLRPLLRGRVDTS